MPGFFNKNAGVQSVFRVGAGIKILDVEVPAFGVCEKIFVKPVEVLGRHWLVIVPPDRAFSRGVAYGELVLGRAPGVLARLDAKRAVSRELAFARADRHFY